VKEIQNLAYLKREVSKATGEPGLMIDADHTDSRSYAPQQVEKQIQIFPDILRREDQKN
jgi:3-deoxy-D-arabino-heptulosonate 7-phosphate (DAHP) synthase